MSYRIEEGEPVAGAFRRIAGEQAEKALANLGAGRGDDAEETAHDTRKRCKKLRGLLRLVRPALGDDYKPANVAYRDAARILSPYRDAHVARKTFGLLVSAAVGRDDDRAPLKAVGEQLEADAESASQALREQIERAAHLIETGLARCLGATVSDDGWDVAGPGIGKTYRRGRKAMKAALASRDPEDFHEWRKRCKYTWYQLRLLENTAPWVLGPLKTGFHALASTLGDAHDLFVLVGRLDKNPARYGGDEAVGRVRSLAASLRDDLERRSERGGRILYGEPHDRFVEQPGRYWETWREFGTEPPLVELEDLADRALRPAPQGCN